MCFAADDLHLAAAGATSTGATAKGAPFEEDGGLTLGLRLESGESISFYEFLGQKSARATANRANEGDVVAVIVKSPDPGTYLGVLSAAFGNRALSDSGAVEGVAPTTYLQKSDIATAIPVFRVADMAARLAQVAELGGSRLPDDPRLPGIRFVADPSGFPFGLDESNGL